MSRYSFNRTSEERNATILTTRGKPFTPFWLPEQGLTPHKADYVRTMGRKALANVLNYLHFSDRSLLVHVQDADLPNGYLVAADPEPCLDGDIMCRWAESPVPKDSAAFIRNLVIDDGKSMIIVPLEQVTSNKNTLTARIPEVSYVLSRRKAKRYPCSGVSVALELKGRRLEGELKDFSSSGFCVGLETGSTFRQPSFRAGDVVNAELKRDDKVFLSGNCSVRRLQEDAGICEMVLQPSSSAVSVFSRRSIRNPRVRLKPAPTISFEHPLLLSRVQMEVLDICSSGFSVCEDRKECLFFSGMLIPDITVEYTGSIIMHCSAQVVYRNEDAQGNAHCGIAILDTEIDGYTRLNHLVESALEPCARISGEIDPDALWEFLFSTGFVYPKKYDNISSDKEDLKKIYKRICREESAIASHFIYQKSGHIYGHISVLRAYERAWMIHHHAARGPDNKRSGLLVLRQAINYLNDMHRLPSFKMNYALCYFRPENRFPNFVFGQFVSRMNDRQACSIDLFSCISIENRFLEDIRLPRNWHLELLSQPDSDALREFYQASSGGLLLDAMSLDLGGKISGELEAVYSRHGLFRRMNVYALKKAEVTIAVLIADHSDRGLSLSELLNCIKVIVLRTKELPWEILRKAVSQLAQKYDMKKIPVMCYPSEYLQEKGVPNEKEYRLWILSVDAGDEFMEYMRERLRISKKSDYARVSCPCT